MSSSDSNGRDEPIGVDAGEVDGVDPGVGSRRDDESDHAIGTDSAVAASQPQMPGPTSRPGLERHTFRATPFVFGLAYAAVGIAGLTGFSSDDTTAWLWAVALLVFGVAGIGAAFARRTESA